MKDELAHTIWAVREELMPLIRSVVSGEARLEDLRAETEPQAAADGAKMAGGIAIIPIRGMITPRGSLLGMLFGGGGGLQEFRSSLSRAVANDEVGSILLDIDSPGGRADLVAEAAMDIRAARDEKPVVAVANTRAASAAYWLASQAGELVVTPSGDVGSVGVFALHEDLSAALEAEGVSLTFIQAGKYKTEGNPYEPLGDEAREAIQSRIDDVYGAFVADVAKGRGVSAKAVRADFGEGRMLGAKDAVKAGMADRVETREAVLARLARGRSGRASMRLEELAQQNMRLADHLDAVIAANGEITQRIADAIAQRAEKGQQLAEATLERVSELESCIERLRETLVIEPPADEIAAAVAAEYLRHAARQIGRN